jgi:hypothetical protein
MHLQNQAISSSKADGIQSAIMYQYLLIITRLIGTVFYTSHSQSELQEMILNA